MTFRTAMLLAGASILFAQSDKPAHASLYYVTYTGTASGTDTYGLFGTAGATLQNAAFTSTFTYDPTLFGLGYEVTDFGAIVLGGQYFAARTPQLSTSPILSADLTINGATFDQGTAYYGIQDLEAGGDYIITSVESTPDNALDFFSYSTSAPVLSLTAMQSLSLMPAQGQSTDGELGYNDELILLDATDVSITDVDSLLADGAPSQSLTDIPEPGTNALLAGAALSFMTMAGGRRHVARHRAGDAATPPGLPAVQGIGHCHASPVDALPDTPGAAMMSRAVPERPVGRDRHVHSVSMTQRQGPAT